MAEATRDTAFEDTEPESTQAWDKTAGAAGEAGPDELDEVLAKPWPEPDPALERSLRPTR
jgi:hypothetical protein